MIRHDHLRFKMYGVTAPNTPDIVDARAFSEKLSILLTALGSADKAANGKIMHDYRIVRAAAASMDFEVQEFLRPRYKVRPSESSIGAINECLYAVSNGHADTATRYGSCARHLGRLGRGAGKRFAFAELWARNELPFLVDEVLSDKADAITSPDSSATKNADEQERWFRGFVFSSFDGTIKEADTRGAMPQGKLVLTAGSREIDCVFPMATGEEVGLLFDKRARFDGMAFYDGKGGLPRRFEVRNEPRLIKKDVDFDRWKGAFESFQPSSLDDLN